MKLRLLHTPAEMEQAQQLQRLVWPGSETDVIPVHVLLTFAHNGGLVLGAYEAERLIGLSVGFPGLQPNGQPKHCSHELGVDPAWRNSGIGFALKREQRRLALAQGLNLITWTYDPLLSRNAHLNLGRLGAVCNTYLRELYGEMRDGLNAGLPSDRFQVDWWIAEARVEQRLQRSARPERVLPADIPGLYPPPAPEAAPLPPENLPALGQPRLLIYIPSDFLALKQIDLGLALAWRLFSRALFEQAFHQGYLAADFFFDPHTRLSAYLLEKRPAPVPQPRTAVPVPPPSGGEFWR